TVSGINLVLTQTADFDAYVQKNGFDKLVAFMKSRSA
ncbi:MAG: ABC transporter substrate-binding protein, partial [Alphaproteobacteria bacterium]|nr:ABC transporter substrate-binding protein [Alphaproteobacteria bacterium]